MPQAFVTAFLIGLLSVSCAPPASPQPTAEVVRFAWEDVGAPTPFRVSTAGPGGVVMLSLLYDTLTWKDERGIIPWLARSWEVSPDGRDYTFTLAPGVTWHDGEKLDATDVAFSFAYYAEHPFSWTATSAVESATALAVDRIQVRLRRPYAPFLEEIAGSVPILPEHIWSRVEAPASRTACRASRCTSANSASTDRSPVALSRLASSALTAMSDNVRPSRSCSSRARRSRSPATARSASSALVACRSA
jgi:ABC-type transport system substrate-binding protein